MRIWILRHGQAAAQAASDAERPLTTAGEAEVQAMSALLAAQPLVSQLVSLLVDGNRASHYPMPTAALACIDLDFVAAGLGTLVALRVPADLAG